jgi:DUF1365 family protein
LIGAALYPGVVVHQRFHPVGHRLKYRIFSVLLDLDELASGTKKLRLFSVGRFNLVSFYERDHGAGSDAGLADWVRGHCARAGIDASGSIQLLCMPRVLGHAFNPLSVFFCHGADGVLRGMLYQVNNTFGQRHSYLIPVRGDAGETIDQASRKNFYVSPFMPMEMDYRFRVTPPGARMSVIIEGFGALAEGRGRLITASLSGRRVPLTDGGLLRAVGQAPLLGLKVLGAIHWEALRLWRKKLKLYPQPLPPEQTVTIVAG